MLYTAEDSQGGAMLCATISDLTSQLRAALWQQRQPIILASGTMAVGSDFRRFKEETGLLTDGRVTESVAPSPFDYKRNCLLYLPQFPPKQDGEGCYDELAAEIADLLDAAHGHALVLFTSYAAMSSVTERLKKLRPGDTLFAMGRNAAHTMEQFKASPGSVLLATGAAWEGFDFPGDCVSLLIIPRLPFACPDAMKEKERENYASLKEFLRAVVVPEMQIKLRQGFGRAIRTETDTCVVAILDERPPGAAAITKPPAPHCQRCPSPAACTQWNGLSAGSRRRDTSRRVRHDQHQDRAAVPYRHGYFGTDAGGGISDSREAP